jgi:hypothetical protein
MLSLTYNTYRKGTFLLFNPEDRKICHSILRSAIRREDGDKPPGDLALAVGIQFLGGPYVSDTLEQCGSEKLAINLRQMDCFTFVENVVGMAVLIREGKTAFADFAAVLKALRYRGGQLQGYASRLHYFSDWLYDNQKKGFLKDISREAGGESHLKKINFMTSNRSKYPALKNEDEFGRMLAVEKACSGRNRYYIPKARLQTCAHAIKNGDLIAIVTNREGLDVVHVGFAIRIKKWLHLLHASQQEGQVVISGDTLYRYLARRKTRLGIMAARIL